MREAELRHPMSHRAGLLDRLCLALSRPGVNGVLGTPDVLEDLLSLFPPGDNLGAADAVVEMP